MASIKAVLRTNKKKRDGKCPIAIRLIRDRKTRYIFTGYYVLEKDWHSEASMVKKSHPNSARLNNYILKKLSEANDLLLEAETSEDHFTIKEIKGKIKGAGRSISFFQFATERIKNKYISGVFSVAKSDRPKLYNLLEFINLKKSDSRQSAIHAIEESRKKRLIEGRWFGHSFLDELKLLAQSNALYFEDINQAFLSHYKTFCVSHLNMKTRTITNQLIFIRTLFNDAISQGIVEAKHYPFAGEKVKINIGSGLKIGLTKEEVGRIENLELDPESQLCHTRNVWLITYYFAGIRITDALKLIWTDFKDGRLFYIMDKNEKPLSLKVPDKAFTILNYYKSSKRSKTDFVFPYLKEANISDKLDMYVKARNASRLLNKYLKKIAEICEIDKNLSNHIARHTFGNIAGDAIHPLMLQKLYRHSDLKTTINYQANFIHKEADEALDSVLNS